MKKMKLLIILCIAFQFANSQTTYFVDGAGGNDLNTGTSLVKAWKTIQKACNAATPNSIVLIKGGTYHENIVVNVSGTPGNPITFRNYMNDSVYIDGTGTAGITMLYIHQKSYLNFRGLIVQNLTVNYAVGILIDTSLTGKTTALSFSNITIRHINWTSNPATIPTSSNNAQGFIAYGSDTGLTNLTIDSCHVYSNILGFSEAVSIDGNIDGFSVTNCVVHDNTNIGIDAAGNYGTSIAPATDHARHGVISNNICYKDFSNYATSGGIYVDGGWNVTVEKNSCYQNGYGIEVGCEQNGTTDSITVKNNLLYNNQETGLAIGGYTNLTTGQVLNTIIRNNTFFQNNYANDGNGEIYMTKASNCIFKNNVFYTNSQNMLMWVDTIIPQKNNIFSYNCWYTPNNDSTNISVQWKAAAYTTFNSYRIGASEEAGSIYADPILITATLPTPDLHLKTGSPGINSGDPATVISAGETDYDGNPRIISGRIDKGAYEYNGAVGIAAINPNNNFSIYPNPAKEAVSIKCDEAIRKVELLNALGEEIEIFQSNCKYIPVSKLKSGLYFIRLTMESGKTEVEPFVKN
jgi:hypothetical protein